MPSTTPQRCQVHYFVAGPPCLAPVQILLSNSSEVAVELGLPC